MSVIDFFQTIHCKFLDVMAQAGDYIVSLPFLITFFAFILFFCDKKFAIRAYIGFYVSFFAGAVLLKSIIKTPRPFVSRPELFAIKNQTSFSTPSFALMVVGGSFASGLQPAHKEAENCKCKRKKHLCLVILSIIALLLISFVKLYTAQNYLLDILLGFVLGGVIFYLAFRYFESNFNIILPFLAIVPVVILLINFGSISLCSQDQSLYKYCGFFISSSIGLFLETKFIKYKNQNNLFTIMLKIATTIIFLCLPLLVFELLKVSNILAFLEYLLIGIIVTVILPMLFRFYNNKFYIFDKSIDSNKAIFSTISLCKKQTYRLAKKLDKYINRGDTIVLCGDLGAGKSELVRGYLIYKGVKNKITSPTFTLVNEHFGEDEHFYHFDLYRIEQEEEVKNLDFEEIIDDACSIKFVEWAEKAPSYLPQNYKKITIIKLGTNTRNIILEQINGEQK